MEEMAEEAEDSIPATADERELALRLIFTLRGIL
jgi:hypothetical protein